VVLPQQIRVTSSALGQLPLAGLLAVALLSVPAAMQAASPETRRTGAPPIRPGHTALPPAARQTHALAQYRQLPPYFEPNLGQSDAQVQFLGHADGYNMFLTSSEAVLVLARAKDFVLGPKHEPQPVSWEQASVHMKLEGANSAAPVKGLEKQPGISAYFVGSDPKKWQPEVPHYGRVEYRGVYPGVDLVYRGHKQAVEFDFEVAPGADPAQIRLAYQGAEKLRVDASGDLVLTTRLGDLTQHRPLVYQEIAGKRVAVAASYRLEGSTAGIELAAYDHSQPLVIDPATTLPSITPAYSTVVGGTQYGTTTFYGVAVDSAGAVYLTGEVFYPNLPTVNAYQSTPSAAAAFVIKLNPDDGSGAVTLAYSTYLGSSLSVGESIALDSTGAAYVGGYTNSTSYPTLNGLSAANGGSPPSGSTDTGFVTKLNAYSGSGSVSLAYSTFLGGATADGLATYANGIYGIAVDSAGAAYVTGTTTTSDFPLVLPYQSTHYEKLTGNSMTCGGEDAFISKIKAYSGSSAVSLAYSSYFGGRDVDYGTAIAVDQYGAAYMTGVTNTWCLWATGDTNPSKFPLANAYQSSIEQGYGSAYVAKFYANDGSGSSSLTLAYSTYLGGSYSDYGYAIAVDSSGSAYVGGLTGSTDFPTVNAYQSANYTGNSGRHGTGFVTKFTPDGTGLVYSTYLGGSTLDTASEYITGEQDVVRGVAVDSLGAAYVVGFTQSSDFPVSNAYQSTSAGNLDAFLTKFNPNDGSKTLTMAYSTFLGGPDEDYGYAVAVGADGAVYVAGLADWPYEGFPLANSYMSVTGAMYGDGFVTKFNPALLMVASAHTGNFSQGQQGATYTLTVANASNAWGPTYGTVTVTESLPSGLALVSMKGTGWSCSSNSCTCGDALPPGYSYPVITVTVNVSAGAAYTQVNAVSVSGGASNPAGATDSTTVLPVTANATTTTASTPSALTYSTGAQGITLSATVTSTAGTVGGGSVSFTLLGITVTGSVTSGSASASFTVPAATAAGSYTISATYVPGTGFAASGDTSKLLTIGQATPVITWSNPADMTFGSALSSTQLNATANVAGTFAYNPASGTVLAVGTGQTLSTTFTPADTTDYTSAAKSVIVNVTQTASPASPAQIVVTKTLARNGSGQVVTTLNISNTGGTDALNVQLTIGKIGATSGTPLPQTLGTVAKGATVTATLTFPASVGASVAAASLTVGGTYAGGSFSTASRITLP